MAYRSMIMYCLMRQSVLFWIWVPALYAGSFKPRFDHITVKDGLPEASAIDIIQDRQGFIWAATLNGLVRYDGHEFLVFKPDPDNSESLADRELLSVVEDGRGRIWIGTGDLGVECFDPKTRTFSHFPPGQGEPGTLSGTTAWVVYEDRRGIIWAGTENGLNRIDPTTNQVQVFQHDEADPFSLPHNDVRALFEDRSGRFWIGTRGGLGLLDRETGRVTTYRHHADRPTSLSDNRVSCIYEDRGGTLWIGCGVLFDRSAGGGLNRYQPASDDFQRYRHNPEDPTSLSHDNVLALVEDHQGRFWVGTGGTDFDGGLNLFDRETGQCRRFSHDPKEPESMSHNRVTALAVDRGGSLWVGSWLGCINKMDPEKSAFRRFRYDPETPGGLRARSINTLFEATDGYLWLGGWGSGLIGYDPASGQFSNYKGHPDEPNGLGDNDLTNIIGDGNGRIWVGTWRGGLFQFDPQMARFEGYRHDPLDPASLSGNRITVLWLDRKGDLWVGTDRGLNHKRKDGQGFRRLMANGDDPNSLSHPYITALTEDQQGRLWIVTGDDGLQRLDPQQDRLVRFGASDFEQIRTIMVDGQGRMWVGSHTNGLHQVDMETGGRLASFDERHGLPIDSVRGILGDDQGSLWISTARGLAQFDPDTKTFQTFTEADGLPRALVEIIADARGPSGTMYFGGADGFISFRPNDETRLRQPAPVALTSVQVLGKRSRTLYDLSSTPVLEPEQNNLHFEFTALSFGNHARHTYEYRLNRNHPWIDIGSRRELIFVGLAPGTYRFEVRAASVPQQPNQDWAALAFQIRTPWYQTNLALLMFAGMALLVFYAFYHQRVSLLRRYTIGLEGEVAHRTSELTAERDKLAEANHLISQQAVQLSKLDRLKSRFFASLSHEFRTPLQLILGPVEDALHGEAEPVRGGHRERLRMMRRNGRRLLTLINQMLDLSRLETGSMHITLREGDIPSFVSGLVMSFSSLAERRHMQLQFSGEPARFRGWFDADKLEKILNNLVANAFKFTDDHGKILILFRVGPAGDYTLEVKDTGRGIPKDELSAIFQLYRQVDATPSHFGPGSGIGLSLTRELVQLLGGSIEVSSEPGFGSSFTVELPSRRGAWSDGANLVFEEDTRLPLESRQTNEVLEENHLEVDTPLADDAPLILIVEDNDEVRAYIRRHLSHRYRLLEAVNGEEGIEIARKRQPALIVSDVMMPKMDGYDLCRLVKGDEKLNHIAVILLTAKAGEDNKVTGLEIGADDYLYKPFNGAELRARVENLIEARRVLRQRFSGELTLAASKITVKSADAVFLDRARQCVEDHMADTNFGVEALAENMNVGARQLHRRLRGLVDLSSAAFIRTIRLQRATDLLAQKAGGVAEIAHRVGFNDVDYFSRLFRQAYGMPPSKYRDSAVTAIANEGRVANQE